MLYSLLRDERYVAVQAALIEIAEGKEAKERYWEKAARHGGVGAMFFSGTLQDTARAVAYRIYDGKVGRIARRPLVLYRWDDEFDPAAGVWMSLLYCYDRAERPGEGWLLKKARHTLEVEAGVRLIRFRTPGLADDTRAREVAIVPPVRILWVDGVRRWRVEAATWEEVSK